jgi:hypothetical protein
MSGRNENFIEDKIDQALKRHFARDAVVDGASVMAKLAARRLPQQKRPTMWPQLLLDWQFTPAWPRMVALAGCAALGFIAGTAGIDRMIIHKTNTDLTLAAFEPEPLTGLRP